jgi:GH18 family chitinase
MDNNLGGIMFWEITQDTKESTKSLLGAIDTILNPPQ